jgi:hypothetical protein
MQQALIHIDLQHWRPDQARDLHLRHTDGLELCIFSSKGLQNTE